MGIQLYYISTSSPLASQSAVTLLQAFVRIASSYHGFREVARVPHLTDSITALLKHGDEFAVFWTTLLLKKLTHHVIPSTISKLLQLIKFLCSSFG